MKLTTDHKVILGDLFYCFHVIRCYCFNRIYSLDAYGHCNGVLEDFIHIAMYPCHIGKLQIYFILNGCVLFLVKCVFTLSVYNMQSYLNHRLHTLMWFYTPVLSVACYGPFGVFRF